MLFYLVQSVPFLLLASALLLSIDMLRKPALRPVFLGSLGLVAAFIALDALVLAALPWLGISYGPFVLPLVVMVIVRLMLYIAWGIILRVRRQPVRRLWSAQAPFLVVQGVVLALVVDAFMVEPQLLTLTQVNLTPPPEVTFSGSLRIVHLTDLHVERITHREQALMDQVRSLQPDLILMTGDYLNLSYLGDPDALRDARTVLGSLQARYGIYAVNGSVDNAYRMGLLFKDLDVHVLDDQMERLVTPQGVINVIGVTDSGYEHGEVVLQRLAGQVPPQEYAVLLFHSPDLAEKASQSGIDLYLCGHTHGGQIRAPGYGAIVTFSRYGKQYEAGRYQVGPSVLYVSRGLGMEGNLAPRARFLAPPEMEVFTLSAVRN